MPGQGVVRTEALVPVCRQRAPANSSARRICRTPHPEQVALEGVKVSGETVHFAIPGLGAGGMPLVLEGIFRGDVTEGTAMAPAAPAPWRETRISA